MTRAASFSVIFGLCVLPHVAHAQTIRRRFEPTDLRLHPKGVAEVDVQAGVLEGPAGTRALAPDVEASLGVSSHAQIQIDTAFGFADIEHARPRFIENTWASIKMGMFDSRDGTKAWAGGVQAGPRLPTAPSAHGIGAEILGVFGRSEGRVHVFGQGGFLVEPFLADIAGKTRPSAIEGGIDLDLDLDARDLWSIRAELGGAYFFHPRLDLLHATAGVSYHVVPWLELSAIGLVGLAGDGDRFGALIGAAPRFRLF